MPKAWTCISHESHGSFPQPQLLAISDRLGLKRITCPMCLALGSLGKCDSLGWMRPASIQDLKSSSAPIAAHAA
jgi:hypothetical protein